MEEKLIPLRSLLADLGSVVIAYSGGVDSTLLVSVATEVLGDRALAVTASSPIHPDAEVRRARSLAEGLGVRHVTIQTRELDDPMFAANDEQRCYYCKRALFHRLRAIADTYGLAFVADGTNSDDLNEHRPGTRAAEELGVIRPLAEAGLTKAQVRVLARGLGLPNWNKPSLPCLATRIPFGTPITEEPLRSVEQAEERLASLGLWRFRVRHHGPVARIEVSREDTALFADEGFRNRVVNSLRSLGYTYVTLDLAAIDGKGGYD